MIDELSNELKEKIRKIKILVLDVDGVMTDGSIILGSKDGEEYKVFNVRDGTGIKMIQRAGLKVALITGRSSSVVERRSKELGITDVHQGSLYKMQKFDEILEKYDLSYEEAVFMGDDIIDIPVMKKAAIGIAVKDADSSTFDAADIITENVGGKGAVREITDLILKVQGKYDDVADYNYFKYSQNKT
jgi:3-deoxy-D-manno-octulosonate 8-phosphate phosphatase (KDO 8-P phosphatase)